MGRLSGRPGRDINLLLEAVLLRGETLSRRHRGRGFTVSEACEYVEAYAALWTPGLPADDTAFWEERVALLTGDAEHARRLAQAAASRRDAIDMAHPDAREIAALVTLVKRGDGPRWATVAGYLSRVRSGAQALAEYRAGRDAGQDQGQDQATAPLPLLPALPPPWEPPPPSPSAFRAVPQLPKAEQAPAAADRTGCPPFRRPYRHRPEPPACVPDYVPAPVPALVAPR